MNATIVSWSVASGARRLGDDAGGKGVGEGGGRGEHGEQDDQARRRVAAPVQGGGQLAVADDDHAGEEPARQRGDRDEAERLEQRLERQPAEEHGEEAGRGARVLGGGEVERGVLGPLRDVGVEHARREVPHVGHDEHGQHGREREAGRFEDVPALGDQQHDGGHGEASEGAEDRHVTARHVLQAERRVADRGVAGPGGQQAAAIATDATTRNAGTAGAIRSARNTPSAISHADQAM